MMADRKPEEIIEEALAKGAILAVMYFDVHANDRNAVQPALVDLVKKINTEPGIISVVGEIEEPMENNGMWSSAAEVTLLVKNFQILCNIALRFAPFGIEVIKPNEIKISLSEAQTLLVGLAQVAYEYSKFLQEKVLSKEEKEMLMKKVAARIEMEKRMLEQKVKKDEKKD